MSKAMSWISRNLSIGGLVRNAGKGAGKATKYAAQGTGIAASLLVDDPSEKEEVKRRFTSAGDLADTAISKGSGT